MTDTDTAAAPAPSDVPQITVSAQEAEFVARAADIDGLLNWDSTDHDAVVEREAATAKARTFIAMAEAYRAMPEFPAEEPEAPTDDADADPPTDGDLTDGQPTDGDDGDADSSGSADVPLPAAGQDTGAQQQAAS